MVIILKRILIITVLLFSLTGCIYKSDVRPTNQVPSLWFCEEAQIELFVPYEYKENGRELVEPVCTLNIDGETVECDILFDGGTGVTFTLDENRSLYGTCTYEKEYFIVDVESDTIYNEKYDKLNFQKIIKKE